MTELLVASGLGALGLIAYLVVTLVRAKDAERDALVLLAQREAELHAAASQVAQANVSTARAVDAEHAQEARGDALEKELNDAASDRPDVGGVDRLRSEVSHLSGDAPTRDGGRPEQ